MISKRDSSRGHVWILALFIVVMMLMLFAIIFGVRIYASAAKANAETTQLRAVEGYLASALKTGDENNSVSVAAGPEGDALVISSADGNATTIYLHEGKLVEEYGPVSNGISPDNATSIAPLSSFSAAVEGAQVTVTTNLGTVVNTMRSAGDA